MWVRLAFLFAIPPKGRLTIGLQVNNLPYCFAGLPALSTTLRAR
jgi:hypothetical protein